MRILKHIDYVEKDIFTPHQVTLLSALLDGDWHDRDYIRKKLNLKKLSRSIISARILKPLEELGLIEQEEMLPPKEKGKLQNKRKKKYVRMRKNPDLLFLMTKRDLYQDLYERAKIKKDEKKETLYKTAYDIIDKLCQSHEEHQGTSVSLSPAQVKINQIADSILGHCKSLEHACMAVCIARPDLYEEHVKWQREYAPRQQSRLVDQEGKVILK